MELCLNSLFKWRCSSFVIRLPPNSIGVFIQGPSGSFVLDNRREIMAKRVRIEPVLFQCPVCKKKFFSYHEREWCTECKKEQEGSAGSDDADQRIRNIYKEK